MSVRSYACIYGGDSGAAVGLTQQEVNAVAQISVWSQVQSAAPIGLCTGTLLDARWLLTARHCSPSDDVDFTVALGSGEAPACGPGAGAAERRGVRRRIPHPTLDALLLELDAPVGAVDFAPPVLVASDDLAIDDPVVIAGFGETEHGEVGRLRFASSRVLALDPTSIDVRAGSTAGACAGDSGGPVLGRGTHGNFEVWGLLSEGDASCIGRDRYVRVAAMSAWISGVTPLMDGTHN